MPLRPSIGFAALVVGVLLALCATAGAALAPVRRRADRERHRATCARAGRRARRRSTSPRSSACRHSTTTSRAASRLVDDLPRTREGSTRRGCAHARAARVHVVRDATRDTRRRQRHARHGASRAPHRPRERARPRRVPEAAARRRASCASSSASCATTRQAQTDVARRPEGAGRGDRRQARPGRARRSRPQAAAAAAASRGHHGRRAHHDAPHRRAAPAAAAPPTTTTTTVPAPSTPPPPPDYSPTPGVEPAPRRPVPHLRPPRESRRQLRRGEPVGPLPRRLPVPPVHLERDRRPRRAGPTSSACPPNLAIALRPGRDGVGAVPVAGQGPVGRRLLTDCGVPASVRVRSPRPSP